MNFKLWRNIPNLRFQYGTSSLGAIHNVNASQGRDHSQPADHTENLFVRSNRVMLDTDLAKLYGVATKNLNKAVKRNAERFPSDFMFQLSPDELQNLRFQTGTSRKAHGGRRFAPYAFTEQGIAMLSSVLHSQRAVQVNVAIMRTFVRLREMLSTHEDLRRKIDAMEKRYDARFQAVFDTIRQMLETPVP
jgi:phage regulator Rha-like protein